MEGVGSEAGALADETQPGEDVALLEAARDGNVRALDRLLRLHEQRVMRLMRLLGVPPSDREDVAQEVFLRVFRHLRGYRPGRSSFSAWIYRIAVNAAHDHRNRLSRRRTKEAVWDEAVQEAPHPAPGPGGRLEQQDRLKRLEGALAALSERERAVFVLCEVEGLATGEAARALQITSITVRRHLGRARNHLRALLEEAPGEKNDGALNDPASGRVVTS